MNKEREALKNIINNDNCVNDGGTYISEIYEYEFNIIDKALTKLEHIEDIDLDEVENDIMVLHDLLTNFNVEKNSRNPYDYKTLQNTYQSALKRYFNLIDKLRGVKDE